MSAGSGLELLASRHSRSGCNRIVALALLCLCACGGSGERQSASPKAVPALRAATPGGALWRVLPAGADLVLEVDLARLRSNPRIGPLLAQIAPPEPLQESDLLPRAEVMVVAVYDIGGTPRQLIVLQGPALAEQAMPSLGDDILAVGDPDLVRQAEGLQGAASTMVEDEELWALRSQPMPEKAGAAALRVVTRLGFDARVALASRLGISDVPISMTLWADVVDDLAVVADLHSEDTAGAEQLARAMMGLRSRLSGLAFFRYLAISPALQNTQVARSARSVRLVFVLSPRRLRLVLQRLSSQLTARPVPQAPASEAPDTSTTDTPMTDTPITDTPSSESQP